MRSFLLIAVCALPNSAAAECVRHGPPSGATPPNIDGPGSFGELQDTVTLDCLTYVGSIQHESEEHVLIRDERGKVHALQVGSHMGENSGVISKIDADTIYLEQVVNRNGEWEIVVVRFPK